MRPSDDPHHVASPWAGESPPGPSDPPDRPDPGPAPIPPPPPEPEPFPEPFPEPTRPPSEPEPQPEPVEAPRESARSRRAERQVRARRAQLAQLPKKVAVKGGIAAAAILVIAAGVWGFQQLPETAKDVHWHIGFEVYANGQNVPFNHPSYDLNQMKYGRAHVHTNGQPGSDDVLHYEGLNGMACKLWFQNGLKADMTDAKIAFLNPVTNVTFENNATHAWKLYVQHQGGSDWTLESKMSSYKPRQHDRLLFTFGNETREELQSQFDAVLPDSQIPY